jgi:hypothetical protein
MTKSYIWNSDFCQNGSQNYRRFSCDNFLTFEIRIGNRRIRFLFVPRSFRICHSIFVSSVGITFALTEDVAVNDGTRVAEMLLPVRQFPAETPTARFM